MSKLGSVIKQFDDFTQWLDGYDYTKVSEQEFGIFCDKLEKLHHLIREILDCTEPVDSDEDEGDEENESL